MFKRKLIFFAACMGMLLFGIGLITLGAVKGNLESRFHLDAIAAGTLFSILPAGILAGSAIFGRLCDRFGFKWLLIFSCVGMCAGFQGIAYAGSITILQVSIFIFGISGGIINGSTNALVSDISVANKGANLSILGVFYGIGALGMPLFLGILQAHFSVNEVVAAVGWFTLAVGAFYTFLTFPPSKQKGKTEWNQVGLLFNSGFLWLIAFFLFFQSGLEAIINNWTTSYLSDVARFTEEDALYTLSLHLAGMIVMRLLIGSVFRNWSSSRIIWLSLLLLLSGALLLFSQNTALLITGLVMLGAGVAAGFPIMLGLLGERFPELSGTAFSLAFVVALLGNMLINYITGLTLHEYGVGALKNISIVVIVGMSIITGFIFNLINSKNKKQTYVSKTMAG